MSLNKDVIDVLNVWARKESRSKVLKNIDRPPLAVSSITFVSSDYNHDNQSNQTPSEA